MEFYRLKHKPTGLYYKPGQGNNLTTKGKVYTKGPCALNYFSAGIPVRAKGKTLEALKQHYLNIEVKCGCAHVTIPREDFVMEPVNITSAQL